MSNQKIFAQCKIYVTKEIHINTSTTALLHYYHMPPHHSLFMHYAAPFRYQNFNNESYHAHPFLCYLYHRTVLYSYTQLIKKNMVSRFKSKQEATWRNGLANLILALTWFQRQQPWTLLYSFPELQIQTRFKSNQRWITAAFFLVFSFLNVTYINTSCIHFQWQLKCIIVFYSVKFFSFTALTFLSISTIIPQPEGVKIIA